MGGGGGGFWGGGGGGWGGGGGGGWGAVKKLLIEGGVKNNTLCIDYKIRQLHVFWLFWGDMRTFFENNDK